LVELALLYVRAGKLADVGTFSIKGAEIPDDEIVGAFLAQHYAPVDADIAVPVPEEIVVPCLPEGHTGSSEFLSDRARHKVSVVHPKRGARADLLRLANDNAKHAFLEKRRT